MDYTPQNDTTYVVEPKADPVDRIQVEVGDAKQPDAFHPQTKVMRWDNEVNFSARLIDHGQDTWNVVAQPDRVMAVGDTKEVHFYEIEPNDTHPEGASELEIFLLERPASNIVSFSLRTKGLVFFYQPELTQAEIDRGAVRPDNIVGSYAVYASEPKVNFERGKEYKCGKIGHIHRPWIVDANGNGTWGELSVDIDDDTGFGILSVMIPREFLDGAVYPVRHAAGLTFGYTTIGGTNEGWGGSFPIFSQATTGSVAAGATLSSMSFYQVSVPAASKGIGMVYSSDGSSRIDYTSEVVVNDGNSALWRTGNVAGNAAIAASTTYLLGFDSDLTMTLTKDSASLGTSKFYNNGGYSYPPPSSTGTLSDQASIFSIYATYTEPGLIFSNNGMQAILAQ